MSDSTYDPSKTVSAGGDLAGTYPVPTVIDIQGREVANVQPQFDQILTWDGTKWVPSNP